MEGGVSLTKKNMSRVRPKARFPRALFMQVAAEHVRVRGGMRGCGEGTGGTEGSAMIAAPKVALGFMGVTSRREREGKNCIFCLF